MLKRCSLILALLILTNDKVSLAENLLQNGSFEQYDAGHADVPSGWSTASGVQPLSLSGEHYLGASSAQLVADDNSHEWAQVVGAPAIRNVQLSVYVLSDSSILSEADDVSIRATISYRGRADTASTLLTAAIPAGTYGWTCVSVSGTARPDAAIDHITVTLGGRLKQGRMLFDNVVLSEAKDRSPAALLSGKIDDLLTNIERIGNVDASIAQGRLHLVAAKTLLSAAVPNVEAASREWVLGADALSRRAWATMYPEAISNEPMEAHLIFHGHGPTKIECDQHLAMLEKAGANAAFLSLGSWASAAYQSDILPREPGYEAFDCLAYFIRQAHERHMMVFGYIATLYGATKLPEKPRNIYVLHPEWFSQAGADQSVPRFPDPSRPEVVRFLGDVFCELVTKYDLDGVGLDYLRYPTIHSLNYDASTRKAIRQAFGFDILDGDPWIDDRKAKVLQDFRCQAIANLASQIRERVKQAKPSAKMLACLLSDPDEAGLLGQSWERIGESVDYIVPMNYGEASSDRRLIERQAKLCAASKAVLIPAVGGMPDVHQSWTTSEWAGRIALQRKSGASGAAIYRVGDLDPAIAAFLGKGAFGTQSRFPSGLK